MLINIVCVLYQHLQILLEGALQFAKLSVLPGLVFARDTVSGNRRRGPFLCPSCLYTCHPPAGTGDTRQSQKMVKKNFCSLSSRDFSPRPSVLFSVISTGPIFLNAWRSFGDPSLSVCFSCENSRHQCLCTVQSVQVTIS